MLSIDFQKQNVYDNLNSQALTYMGTSLLKKKVYYVYVSSLIKVDEFKNK